MGRHPPLIPFSEAMVAALPVQRQSHLGKSLQFFFTACLATTLAWPAHAVDIAFKPVAPGVYAYVGDLEGRTYENEALNANLGLVVTPGGALLIDIGASLQGAKQIAAAAKKVTPQPIKWVINTGGQDHRWLGNGFFQAQGAEIMAHASAEADMRARGPEQMKANAPVLKDRLDGTEVVLPTRWLKDADTLLDLGGVAVQVVYRGGGHTPGDSMVWLPQSGVVFTGDVVYVDRILGLHPVSKTRTWVQSFEALEALNPRVVVPGHGSVTTLAQAQKNTGALLKALRAHMGKAVEAGTDLVTAVKSFDPTPFKHLKHVDVRDNGVAVTLQKVEELRDIMGYGAMSTPGVLVDGKVVHAGGVPSREKIEQWLVV